MKHLLVGLLASVTMLGLAQAEPVTLLNGTGTDITVETPKHEALVELLPNEVKAVPIRQLRWLRFGQEAYAYNVASIEQKARQRTNPLVLQAHTDGKLYLLPAGTNAVQAKLPSQPRGFPISPIKKVDLT